MVNGRLYPPTIGETVETMSNYRHPHSTQRDGKRLFFLFIFYFLAVGGYIPVNLGNSKRRPMPYYCYLYTPGAASGIYYYIKIRKTGAMKLGQQQLNITGAFSKTPQEEGEDVE
jgi:hypothetical protein